MNLFRLAVLVVCTAAGLLAQKPIFPGPPPPPPEQPIPFSHKTHTAVAKLACKECHADPAKFGDKMGFPATSKCMACHIAIAKDKPTVQKLAGFAKTNQPVPWERMYKLDSFVYFDHRVHITSGATCDICHGPVAEKDVVINDMNSTKMDFCQPCHAKWKASNGCSTCHSYRGD